MEELAPKEKRKILKDNGISAKVSNADVVEQYDKFIAIKSEKESKEKAEVKETIEENTKEIAPKIVEPLKVLADNAYTYVGVGATPPLLIKFMGLQVFRRGEPTEVTDSRILAKIKNNPSFVKGYGLTSDEMYEADLAASQKESQQNLVDIESNNETQKQYQK